MWSKVEILEWTALWQNKGMFLLTARHCDKFIEWWFRDVILLTIYTLISRIAFFISGKRLVSLVDLYHAIFSWRNFLTNKSFERLDQLSTTVLLQSFLLDTYERHRHRATTEFIISTNQTCIYICFARRQFRLMSWPSPQTNITYISVELIKLSMPTETLKIIIFKILESMNQTKI